MLPDDAKPEQAMPPTLLAPWPWRRAAAPLALTFLLLLGGCWGGQAEEAASPLPSGAAATRRLSAEEGQQYLRAAVRRGDMQVLVGLAEAGVPIDQPDERGHTPLVLAAYHGQVEAVKYLVEHGAKPCRENGWGQSALMGAAFKGHVEVVKYLAGLCPIEQTDPRGRTALAFAIVFGRRDVATVLRQMGAKEPGASDPIPTEGAADWQGSGPTGAEAVATASVGPLPWGPATGAASPRP